MKSDTIGMTLGNIMKLSDAETRSITAENVYGKKGRGGMAEVSATPQPEVVRLGQYWDGANPCARELGRTWKVRPCITIPAGCVAPLMDVEGPGIIRHIWITTSASSYRDLILRMYWDGEKTPSVEVPVGDFFCNGWNRRANVWALPINVNPSGGNNCYFPMPFRKRARITVENRMKENAAGFFYAINFAKTRVETSDAYFHAQFRRVNPLPNKQDYVILDGVRGRGHYVGTYMAWQQNSIGWWGEGEVKMFLDGDRQFPTICGTGTEDYFGGAWGFGQTFSAPFLGYPYGTCDGEPGTRHGLYRFHIMDPICFRKNIRVTIQALGWQGGDRYLPLQDDIASVAYWYQTEPHVPFPKLPNAETMSVTTRQPWQSAYVETWRISKLIPKKGLQTVADMRAMPFSKIKWKRIRTEPRFPGFANVHTIFEMADGFVYLAAQIRVRRKGNWKLLLGHDGGIKMFLDGKAVLTRPERANPAEPDRSRTIVMLSQGLHDIVVALDTDRGLGYGIFLRFEQSMEDRMKGGSPVFPECVPV